METGQDQDVPSTSPPRPRRLRTQLCDNCVPPSPAGCLLSGPPGTTGPAACGRGPFPAPAGLGGLLGQRPSKGKAGNSGEVCVKGQARGRQVIPGPALRRNTGRSAWLAEALQPVGCWPWPGWELEGALLGQSLGVERGRCHGVKAFCLLRLPPDGSLHPRCRNTLCPCPDSVERGQNHSAPGCVPTAASPVPASVVSSREGPLAINRPGIPTAGREFSWL